MKEGGLRKQCMCMLTPMLAWYLALLYVHQQQWPGPSWTLLLAQVVEVNNILRQGLEKGLPIVNLEENWDFLQVRWRLQGPGRGWGGEGGWVARAPLLFYTYCSMSTAACC